MYKTLRYVRIAISLIAMILPAVALLFGYESVFARMRLLISLISGVTLVLIFWLVATLFYGRIYCSTVCPLGAMMDCVSTVGRITERRKYRNYKYTSAANGVQNLFLIVFIVSLLSSTAILPTIFDPFSAYARIIREFVCRIPVFNYNAAAFTASAMSIALVTISGIVMFAWRRGRLLCNTICPIGAIFAIISRHAYFHMEIDPDRCINCGECEKACKAQCIKLPEKTIDTGRCVVCFDCASVCPNQALTYKSGRYKLDMPLMQPAEESKSNINTPSE